LNRKLGKGFTAIMIAGFVLSLFAVPSFAQESSDLDSIRDQRESIEQDKTAAEGEISAILDELETLNKETEQANAELAKKQELVKETENKIDTTVDEIAVLEEELKELEEQINERYEILEDRIVSTQASGGAISYLEVIFGSQSFSDFISRVSAVNKIINADEDLMKQIDADMKETEEKRAEVLNKLDELNALKAEQEEAKSAISQQVEQNKQQTANLEQKRQELNASLNELEAEDSSLASLEDETRQQIEAANHQEEEQAQAQADTEAANAEPVVGGANENATGGETFTVTATAYTANCAGCSGVTATGVDLNSNPNANVIAVDPSVIPLGSVVHVEGYGHAIAADTGGAINGNKIDVHVPNNSEAMNWGTRTVDVTILN